MSLALKIVTRTSGTRRPDRQRGVARVVVVLAWLAFWLNTALSPCCEAIAAGIGDQPAPQAVSDAHPAHNHDETHTDSSDQGPNPPCGHVVSAVPADFAQAAVFAAEHQNFVTITPDSISALFPAVASALSLFAYSTPPPQIQLYLRDLRIRL